MIHTVHVKVSRAEDVGPWIWDSRLLLAAQQVLGSRTGVTQAPDLWPSRQGGQPVFVVSMDDVSGTGRYFVTSMIEWLTSPATVSVVYAEDGGIKVQQVPLTFEVAEL